mmetsp:Transcript_22614/g.70787  ORF Transcript_22614/g.70787 Transcript_22614/m.70787 type:complete len:112 (-) Transcript_22614:57-392(-)
MPLEDATRIPGTKAACENIIGSVASLVDPPPIAPRSRPRPTGSNNNCEMRKATFVPSLLALFSFLHGLLDRDTKPLTVSDRVGAGNTTAPITNTHMRRPTTRILSLSVGDS